MYKLTLRSEGGFHARYKKKYGDWHRGMIYVNDVPGFSFILWHTGNSDESTSGCLIFGQNQESNLVKPDGWVGSSVSAYKFVYPRVRDAILSGEDVYVKYIDYDTVGDQEMKRISGSDPVISYSPQEEQKKPTEVYDFSKDFPKWPGVNYKLQKPMMKSEDLKEWQKVVGLSADGWYGNGSKNKVIELQKEFGLKEDGILGKITWDSSFAKNK
jgi:peptidoglycan hydrolase-like protein with peptidoglycan-binding domain